MRDGSGGGSSAQTKGLSFPAWFRDFNTHLLGGGIMKKKGILISRFIVGLLLVAAFSLATAEVTRGSAQAANPCDQCGRDWWCEYCCATPGSICLSDGQCLCN